MGPAGPAERRTSLARVRVLVVEDNFIILSWLKMVFAEAGAEVIVSRTVPDALVKADARVSVAVLDVAIGSHSAEPVVARLAERGVPLLFYTGKLDTDELLAAWPRYKVVTKPTDAKTLVGAVAALLNEKRTERPGRASAMAGFLMRWAAGLLVKMRLKEPAPKGRKPTSL
jgi:DNA-binding response OmpR family regulator